jgi:hypothetical protein
VVAVSMVARLSPVRARIATPPRRYGCLDRVLVLLEDRAAVVHAAVHDRGEPRAVVLDADAECALITSNVNLTVRVSRPTLSG